MHRLWGLNVRCCRGKRDQIHGFALRTQSPAVLVAPPDVPVEIDDLALFAAPYDDPGGPAVAADKLWRVSGAQPR